MRIAAPRRTAPLAILILVSTFASQFARPVSSRAADGCLATTLSAIGPATRVRIDFVDGSSTQGLGLHVRSDSLVFRRIADDPALAVEVARPRAEIAGLAYGSKKEVDPHWGIIGFGAGYLATAGAWAAANPGTFDAPLVGLFGGCIGAALASFLPPLTVGSESYVSCEDTGR